MALEVYYSIDGELVRAEFLFAGFSNENCKIIPHTHLQPTLSPSPGNIKVLIFYYVIVFMFTFIWTCFRQSVIETIYIIPVQSVWTGLSPAVDWPWLLIVSTHCRHHIDRHWLVHMSTSLLDRDRSSIGFSTTVLFSKSTSGHIHSIRSVSRWF